MKNINTPVAIFPASLQDACPRSGCGMKMATVRVEDFEVTECGCGYQCKTISGALKLEYHAGLFERTAQRRLQ